MLFDKTKFKTKKELLTFIVENKAELIAQKKSIIKQADGFAFSSFVNKITDKGISYKANNEIQNPSPGLIVLAVINTTNWFDSHEDVHIPGLWTKTLNENKSLMHVQEHKSNEFNKIISSGNDLKAYIEDTTWKGLGYDLEGNTQALMFESLVKETRNPYMHNQYAKGYVTNHSVGMRYVKLIMCVNDSDWGAEFEAWEKYLPQVTNKETAEENGYFWAVTEAKLIEGSAVPLGSNPMTPTLDNNRSEPLNDTLTNNNNDEPDKSTHYSNLVNNLIKNL